MTSKATQLKSNLGSLRIHNETTLVGGVNKQWFTVLLKLNTEYLSILGGGGTSEFHGFSLIKPQFVVQPALGDLQWSQAPGF